MKKYTPEQIVWKLRHADRELGKGLTVTGPDVVRTLDELFSIRSRPGYIRSDNGPEFASKAVKKWLKRQRVGHRTGQPVGERVRRELQREVEGRVPQRRIVLELGRGAIRCGSLAAGL